jgi:NAD(P)-dependent dehydrogenase (short-subunit alcohol dehydrogenase family)
MKKQGYGRIISTASHTGFGWRGFTHYSAVKEGLAGFTRTLARDMADFGVTANAIAAVPGGVPKGESGYGLNSPDDVASGGLPRRAGKYINGRIFEFNGTDMWVSLLFPPPVQKSSERGQLYHR